MKRRAIQSCCGKSSYLFQPDKPIQKAHVDIFEGAGYSAPSNFKNHGVFYVRGHNIIATSPFGTNRISVRCWGDDCERILDEFSILLEKAVNTI